MDHAELISRAWGADGVAEGWPGSGSEAWQAIVKRAEAETLGWTPVSAAVWEALWRVDPSLTPAAWRDMGPAAMGASEDTTPNPFLDRSAVDDGARWLQEVVSVDLEAADLLAAAIRAERIEDWCVPEVVIARYSQALAAYDAQLEMRVAAGPQPASSEQSELSREFDLLSFLLHEPRSLRDELDDLELTLTRLLLIGHKATTVSVLPLFLAGWSAGNPSDALDSAHVVDWALSRLDGGRIGAAAGAIRSLGTIGRGAAPTHVDRRLGLSKAARAAVAVGVGAALSISSRKPRAPAKRRG